MELQKSSNGDHQSMFSCAFPNWYKSDKSSITVVMVKALITSNRLSFKDTDANVLVNAPSVVLAMWQGTAV